MGLLMSDSMLAGPMPDDPVLIETMIGAPMRWRNGVSERASAMDATPDPYEHGTAVWDELDLSHGSVSRL
jgi:hypothetical protein